jgi:hypothetical protein
VWDSLCLFILLWKFLRLNEEVLTLLCFFLIVRIEISWFLWEIFIVAFPLLVVGCGEIWSLYWFPLAGGMLWDLKSLWRYCQLISKFYLGWLKLWIWRSSHDTWRYISSIHWTHSSIATASTTLYAQEFSRRLELLATWWCLCCASLCLCLVGLLAQGEAKLKWSLSSTNLNADAMSVFLISYVSWVLVLMAIRVCTQSDRQESFNHMSFSWCMWLLYISLHQKFWRQKNDHLLMWTSLILQKTYVDISKCLLWLAC